MRLYRSHGYLWSGTQADARELQGGKDFEQIEVPTVKEALIQWLNEHAPGKGANPHTAIAAPAPVAPPEPAKVQPVATGKLTINDLIRPLTPGTPPTPSGNAMLDAYFTNSYHQAALHAEKERARIVRTTDWFALMEITDAMVERIEQLPQHDLDKVIEAAMERQKKLAAQVTGVTPVIMGVDTSSSPDQTAVIRYLGTDTGLVVTHDVPDEIKNRPEPRVRTRARIASAGSAV